MNFSLYRVIRQTGPCYNECASALYGKLALNTLAVILYTANWPLVYHGDVPNWGLAKLGNVTICSNVDGEKLCY